MYANLEKLPALRYRYDLGGCVTVKIASIQGSRRLAFCSATEANPSPPYAITGTQLANTMREFNAPASWPAFSIASPNQLNLNQTGGAAAVGAMDVYSPVYTTYFTGPELKATYSLDDAYTWEEGMGDRCDLWRSLAPLVPM
jgi:hypothetical protein